MNFKSAMTAALSGGLALTGALALPGSAHAALHGFCSTTAPCTDNGINTPTSMDPPTFGFSAGATSDTGTYAILFLIPDTADPNTTYTLSGPLLGSSTQPIVRFEPGRGIWASRSLDTFLGMPPDTSPDNALSDFLPATQAVDPGATGYYVYDRHIGGNFTLPSDADASNSDLLTLDKALPAGSYVYALLGDTPTGDIGTVSSGAIFIDPASRSDSAAPEPSTWAMLAIGFAGLGFVGYRKAHRTALPAA